MNITGGFFYSEKDKPHIESLQKKIDASDPSANIPVTAEEMAALRNRAPVPDEMDHGDIQMLFRCLMQFARHLAKKYNFTIRQWPEK